jgi:hypothetical protein
VDGVAEEDAGAAEGAFASSSLPLICRGGFCLFFVAFDGRGGVCLFFVAFDLPPILFLLFQKNAGKTALEWKHDESDLLGSHCQHPR